MFHLLMAVWIGSAFGAPPADIDSLQRYVLNGATSSETIRSELFQESLSQVDKIARARDYPEWFNSSNPMIKKELERLIQSAVPTSQNKDAVYKASVDAFSGYYAEEAMARAAHMPSVSRPSSSRTGSLSKSASVTGSKGVLEINMSKSTVKEDIGFMGTGNGVLEKGERAVISVYFENAYRKRLYSTSLYIKSVGDCLFTTKNSTKEYQLPELNPGQGVELSIEVYISKSCQNGDYALKIDAYDSNVFSQTPKSYTLTFKPKTLGLDGQLYKVKLDSDDYGHSEPTDPPPLLPDTRVELSTGFQTRMGKVDSILQTYHTPHFLTGEHSVISSPVVYSSNGIGRSSASDDLDITVPSKGALSGSLQDEATFFEWQKPEDAVLFVAVDTTLKKFPSGTTQRSYTESITQLVVDEAKVKLLLQKHIEVAPFTQQPKPSATSVPLVAVDGFQVNMSNPDELMASLAAATKSTTVTKIQDLPAEAPNSFVFRHYIALPIYWEPEIVPPMCSISLANSQVYVDDGLSISAQLKHVSPGNVATLSIDGKELKKVDIQDPQTNFTARTVVKKSGSKMISLVVKSKDEVVCVSQRNVNVKSKKKAVVSKLEPRLFSVEGGIGGERQAMLGLSVGKSVRFETNLYNPSLDYGSFSLNGGIRFTQVVSKNEKTHYELSESLLLGRTNFDSSFRSDLTFSVHRGFGVYSRLTLIELSGSEFVAPSMIVGVGGYFPKR